MDSRLLIDSWLDSLCQGASFKNRALFVKERFDDHAIKKSGAGLLIARFFAIASHWIAKYPDYNTSKLRTFSSDLDFIPHAADINSSPRIEASCEDTSE